MNYNESKKIKQDIENSVKLASDALRLFPKLDNGLVQSTIRLSPEFVAAKNAYNQLFFTMRRINEYHCKSFKKEIREEKTKK